MRIAIVTSGQGPIILRAAHWLSHCQYDLESPVWRPWLEAFSARNRFVRYDPRGCGLADRFVADLSLDACQADFEAVAATIQEPRFVLLGLSQGGATAIRFALSRPERVSHLLLVNAYAQGDTLEENLNPIGRIYDIVLPDLHQAHGNKAFKKHAGMTLSADRTRTRSGSTA